jgi:hypothetical protein
MNTITTLLLFELGSLPLPQKALRRRLASWDFDADVAEITESLLALEADGLVSGVSLLDHLPVTITFRGQHVARQLDEVGADLGGWRQVA